MSNLTLNNWNHTFGIYDFDWNILKTDTPIFFKNKITWKIEKISGYIADQNHSSFYGENSTYEIVNHTFSENRDFFIHDLHRWFDWLIEDTLKAIENWEFAPSFQSFKEMYLIKARIFAILTARWNGPDNFQRAFHLINNLTLNKEEKEEQHENIIKNFNLPSNLNKEDALYNYFWFFTNYIPCSNLQIEKIMWFEWMKSKDRKAKAIDFLISHYIKTLEGIYWKNMSKIVWKDKFLSIWFSDDSIENLVAVYNKFQSILRNDNYNPEISKKFSIYFSWKKSKEENLLNELWNQSLFKIKRKDSWLKIKLNSNS